MNYLIFVMHLLRMLLSGFLVFWSTISEFCTWPPNIAWIFKPTSLQLLQQSIILSTFMIQRPTQFWMKIMTPGTWMMQIIERRLLKQNGKMTFRMWGGMKLHKQCGMIILLIMLWIAEKVMMTLEIIIIVTIVVALAVHIHERSGTTYLQWLMQQSIIEPLLELIICISKPQ